MILRRRLLALLLVLAVLLPAGCGELDRGGTGGKRAKKTRHARAPVAERHRESPPPAESSAVPGATEAPAPQGSPREVENPHLTLGNPSLARPSDPDNRLIEKHQYAMSYNNSRRGPNWVAWRLTAEWLGDEPRGKFAPDGSLPAGFVRVRPSDYKEYRGIYDRGHMCPSADRACTREDNDATFLMSNIIPQACGNNQGPWEKLESYARRLVRRGGELSIVCGGAGTKETIGPRRIAVPDRTWKIIVVLPRRGAAAKELTGDARVLAVIMPNSSDIRESPWTEFVGTIEDVEKLTGYDFLRAVPDPARSALRAKKDTEGESGDD